MLDPRHADSSSVFVIFVYCECLFAFDPVGLATCRAVGLAKAEARQRSTGVPWGQVPTRSLPFDRYFRSRYRRVMPSEYENEGIDHRGYCLHDG